MAVTAIIQVEMETITIMVETEITMEIMETMAIPAAAPTVFMMTRAIIFP